MVHRRELLRAGAGLVLAAPLRFPIKLLMGTAGSPLTAPDVLAESGLFGSAELISAAHENARHARVIDIDNTVLIKQLSEAWTRNPRPLFGMTRSDVAVLVEALARDYRMAVVYRGWHDHRAGSSIHHVLYGDATVIETLKREFASAGNSFGKVLGRRVSELAAFGARPVSVNFEVDAKRAATGRTRFVSWAIAPAEPTLVA
ncbi:MAG TPA: hypothetical protein VMD75_05725 [Candidatus Binataceae bacterium]|nr:hypothetical protein [Candidatus Binataceae bacterium]